MLESLPLEVDAVTVLENVKAGPGKIFTYDYRLKGEQFETVSAEDVEAAMRPQLEKNYNGKSMAAFKRGKVQAIYRYTSDKGKLIAEIKIDP